MAWNMNVSGHYGTHLAPLIKAVSKTDGDILELGMGVFSTPFLHYTAILSNRKLVSIENDKSWAKFFFDYGYKHKRQSAFLSLAGFTPLWAGLATQAQAAKIVKKLPVFETEHGLVITAKKSLAPKISLSKIPMRYRPAIEKILKPKQWDYPNIWPPLEYLTVVGLLKYRYVEDAVRIMKKSLETQAGIFRKYGTFFEATRGSARRAPRAP